MIKILTIILIIFNTVLFVNAQTTRKTLNHDDIERNYRLFVPDHYDKDTGGQLIIVLHGGGMDALLMRVITNEGFENMIEEQNLNAIVVYPNGFGNGWNDGRIRDGQSTNRSNIDDVGFLLSITDNLADNYNIDPNDVFVTGFSNGGGMTYRIACEASDRITAIASIASLLASDIPCEPQSSVALLSINGDTDPILPLSGGDLFYWEMSLGSVLSSEDTINIWHSANQCNGYKPSVDLPDVDSNDNTRVQLTDAQDCQTPLSSIIIQNGGHTWAGSDYEISAEEYGLTSQDIDASQTIIDFFMSVGLGQ